MLMSTYLIHLLRLVQTLQVCHILQINLNLFTMSCDEKAFFSEWKLLNLTYDLMLIQYVTWIKQPLFDDI